MLVRNLTNGPIDLEGLKGNVRIPAFGEADDAFSGEYLEILKASNAVEVLPSPVKTKAAPTPAPAPAPAPKPKPKAKTETKTAGKGTD